MNILNKIRSLSDKKRKIILWVIMIILIIFLSSFYIQDTKNILKENEGKQLFDQSDFQGIQEEVEGAKEIIFDNINKSEK